MPYVKQEDRVRLMPLMLGVKERILLLSEPKMDSGSSMWGYLRYAAMRVLEETALNAAEQYQGRRGYRYWLIVDQAGVCMNIAFELYDRVIARTPPADAAFDMFMAPNLLQPVPEDAAELNPVIDALVSEISAIAGPKSSTGGYDYEGAYCGLVNFSLSELAPRVIMDFCADAVHPFSMTVATDIISFWLGMVAEFYSVARKYEDEQIEKNGDIEAYDLMVRSLMRNETLS